MSEDDSASEHERLLAENERLRKYLAAADLCGRIDRLERFTEHLEQHIDQLRKLTGAPPLGVSEPPPGWRPLKEAAEILGYSEPDLLKHIKRWEKECGGGVVWFGPVDGQLFVDVAGAQLPRVVRT